MPIKVVLAVGLDTSFLENQISDWRSAGFSITFARSIREAIVHFKEGNFDLVLLGRSIPVESRERLIFLIRASGSRVPVVCIAESSSGISNIEDATIKNEPIKILDGIKETVANRAKAGTSNLIAASISK